MEPMIIPPTASKVGLHRELSNVWGRAATRLAEANNIFVVGYSWPQTDHFFQQLYALGTVGRTILSRFWVFDINPSVRQRFHDELLGQQARDCFGPNGYDASQLNFGHAINLIGRAFGLRDFERGIYRDAYGNLPDIGKLLRP